MPEPGPNCVDVDARLQQVRGGRMANDVGTDPLCLESRRGGTQLRDVPLDQCVNAVTREGLATTVQKQMRLVGTLPCEATKLLDGFGPERATTLLLPLACYPNRLCVPVDVADPERCRFAHACAGVVKEQQQGMIACTLA